MTVTLNAFPIIFPDNEEVVAYTIPYDQDKLYELRLKYEKTHAFYRDGDQILCFTKDKDTYISDKKRIFQLQDNYRLLSFLFKDALTRFLKEKKGDPRGYNPIELLSKRPEDNILKNITQEDFPFSIVWKYELTIRRLRDKPFLIIDCYTKKILTQKCIYFLNKGFDLTGRYITKKNEYGHVKLFGLVKNVKEQQIIYQDKDGKERNIAASEVYLEMNNSNFDDYIRFSYGNKADFLIKKIRIQSSLSNSGENKKNKIEKFGSYLAKLNTNTIESVNGTIFRIGNLIDVTEKCRQFAKPLLIFNDGAEIDQNEIGFTKFGPYTKKTFNHNNPSICVICSEYHKVEIEQLVKKLLKGIHGHRYFSNGLEEKFHIGISKVEYFTFQDDSIASYRKAIDHAIEKKCQDGEEWDLALVQVKKDQKDLAVEQSPYYIGKSLFFSHHTPVHNFTLELLDQSDENLGYSLNNMALATYAKMGGIPWLLKSTSTFSHELVIGIGSTYIKTERFDTNQHLMGITTVFSGDGSYIVANTSRAVPPDEYKDELINVLKKTLDKVEAKMNWQKGDNIRIVFHASVKKFNKYEIDAVKAVISGYKKYNTEYAFLKISEDHNLHLFDSTSSGERKGRYATIRGKYLKLSKHEILVYLTGRKELRQGTDGHPQGLIVNVHKESNFNDIEYLTKQVFNFSAHSWRSYFPNPMPVTISYSDLIANNLGWLSKVPNWNAHTMIGKIGQTQWFL